MKKFSILIVALALFFVFPLFFNGCSPQNEFSCGEDYIFLAVGMTSDGKMKQELSFSLNSERLSEYLTKKEEVDFKKSLCENIGGLRNQLLLSFALVYMANPVEEFKIGRGLILSDVTIDDENDCAGFVITFSSLASWKYYHGSSQKEQQENGIYLIRKNSSSGQFPFSACVKNGEDEILLGEKYKNVYLDALKLADKSKEVKALYNPNFIYDYFSPFSHLHSNCDYNFNKDGIYHNVWLVENNNLSQDNTISLYSYSINYGLWYLSALIVTLLPCGVILILKHKKWNR